MPAEYPNAIFHARETENLPGVVYNPDNKKSLYSEDFQNLANEVTAIEETLGENLDNIGGGAIDFSAILNPVGWVTTGVVKRAVYTKIGKLVHVEIIVGGTSNSSNCRVTLPFPPSTTTTLVVPCRIINNNGIAVGNCSVNGGTTLAQFGANIIGTNNFTGTGSKAVHLSFSYFTA